MSLSASSRSLERIMAEDGELAERIKQSSIHRTRIHAYKTGRAKPDADTIALLHDLTDGVVAGNGWADEPKRRVARGKKAS